MRPVFLIGPWKDQLTSSALDEMVEEGFRRLRHLSNNPDIDRELDKKLIREQLEKDLPPNTCLLGDLNRLETNKQKIAHDAVDWIRKQVSMTGLVGEFPKINCYDRVASKYLEWLKTAGRPPA